MKPKSGYKLVKLLFEELEIPEEWKISTFENVTKITRLAGYEYSTIWKHDPNGKIIALRGFNIQKNYLDLTDTDRISEQLSNQLSRSKLNKNDIVFPCVGSIGNAALISENNKFHINQNIAKITPENILEPLFLVFFLMSSLTIRQIFKYNASTSQPNVLVGSLRKFQLLIPPLPEQQKIASVLSNVDNLLNKVDEILYQTKRLKQGLMQKLFTRGIDHKNFKTVNFGGQLIEKIPIDWEFKTLEEISIDGTQNGLAISVSDYGSGIPIVGMTKFYASEILTLDNMKEVNISKKNEEHFSLNSFDLLFGRRSMDGKALGSAGKCVIVPKINKKIIFAIF